MPVTFTPLNWCYLPGSLFLLGVLRLSVMHYPAQGPMCKRLHLCSAPAEIFLNPKLIRTTLYEYRCLVFALLAVFHEHVLPCRAYRKIDYYNSSPAIH